VKEVTCSGGLFLSTTTKRFLFLLRTQKKTANTWGFVGGKSELQDLSLYDTLIREIKEEVGECPPIKKVIPLELFVSQDQLFKYNTYVLLVDCEFIPLLNQEHCAYAWCNLNAWPKPLHRGVRNTLNNRIIKSKLELLISLV
jgi:8-oxo-dGTP pyrophosphatase MutT (NUDIX family)